MEGLRRGRRAGQVEEKQHLLLQFCLCMEGQQSAAIPLHANFFALNSGVRGSIDYPDY